MTASLREQRRSLQRFADFQVEFFRSHSKFGRLLLGATGFGANLEPSFEAPVTAGDGGAMSVERVGITP
ncbi:MAG: hypothetical protein FJW88_13250 [Actinobacteria bacterium]|nr:hypothetical protein [Actinomycetota bacterium]